MTREEWLSIGYDKHIIEDVPQDDVLSFSQLYCLWFKMKMARVRGSTLDRIEVTYNRYYRDTDFAGLSVPTIDGAVVCRFLNSVIVNCGVTRKEFERIYQIVNNVLTYGHDMGYGYCSLIDWGYVKRFCSSSKFCDNAASECMISASERYALFSAVLYDNVYPAKRSACLMLLMNFYLGLRIGELASLRFSDFDVAAKLVFVRKNQVKYYNRDVEGCRVGSIVYEVVDELKTVNSKRVVPLTDECISLYRLLVEHHKHMGYDSEYLCYDGSDVIMMRSLERTLSRLCSLCSIQHLKSHKIRKTYASLLHMGGVPTRVITDLCGHSDMETTERCYILNSSEAYNPYLNLIANALSVKTP